MSKSSPKLTTKYVCRECGTWHGKWNGKCEGCGSWNSLIEEVVEAKPSPSSLELTRVSSLDLVSLDGVSDLPKRLESNIKEFDRVCGGGLVPGSVILVGGDPGIGKSTLLLQVASKLSHSAPCLYVSGEEGIDQIRLRAHRMHVSKSPVMLASTSSVADIVQTLKNHPEIRFVVVDSIQTMMSQTLESAPGSVAQIRACTFELIQCGKAHDVIIVLVGHVTKEGALAGPKVLEHMVDTVLYFEGEKHYPYRILRSIKNRFGPTDEIGIFNMVETGLEEVGNPSKLFLNDHEDSDEASKAPVSTSKNKGHTGIAIYAGLEGSRPILAEIQTLIAPSYLPSPRRTAVGIDPARLAMILAVLESRCNINFGTRDVFVNVAGGLKITETACDLAVAAALISSHSKKPLPTDTVFFGEIGLGGEVRRVQQPNLRLKEAEKLGFKHAVIGYDKSIQKKTLTQHTLRHINDLILEYISS